MRRKGGEIEVTRKRIGLAFPNRDDGKLVDALEAAEVGRLAYAFLVRTARIVHYYVWRRVRS